jgi:hypothetical protein
MLHHLQVVALMVQQMACMWHRHPKALLSVVLSVGMSHQVLAAELMV